MCYAKTLHIGSVYMWALPRIFSEFLWQGSDYLCGVVLNKISFSVSFHKIRWSVSYALDQFCLWPEYMIALNLISLLHHVSTLSQVIYKLQLESKFHSQGHLITSSTSDQITFSPSPCLGSDYELWYGSKYHSPALLLWLGLSFEISLRSNVISTSN